MAHKVPQSSTSIYQFATQEKGIPAVGQMLKALPYEVLTYQIPVPLGDCSVHVLLQKGKVMRSFIMDGGDYRLPEKAVVKIKMALKFIRGDLITMNPANSAWKLDSWVVTHWDEDHYVGVMDLATKDKDLHPDKKVFAKDTLLFCGAKYDDDNCPKIKVSEQNRKKINEIGFNHKYVGKNLVGMDLFTGIRIFDGMGNLAGGSNAEKGQPRFCCLAADGYGLGVKRMTPHNRNETSILSILYWPISKRSSYYTGGDGYPKLADDIATKFLGREKPYMNKHVTVIKLDHHGSSREFFATKKVNKEQVSINMLRHTDPKKVLVTPGKGYGHPCWDVIVFLNCWRMGRVEHGKSKKMDPINVTALIEKAKKSKTAEKKQDSISREEECDDEPGTAKEYDGGDFLYTTRDPYWFSEEVLTETDLNISSRRIATARNLLNQLPSVNADINWVFERILLGDNFLTVDEEEPKIKAIDVKGKKHVVQKPESDKEGIDINAAKLEDDVKDSEDVKIDPPANDDRIKVQKELEAAQFQRLLEHYNEISPHPAEGSDGSGLSPGDNSLDDDAQDIWDMLFLNIVAWDRLSKQKFSKDKKDPYYLLKMSSSDNDNDGKIDILTSEGEPALLPTDNYSRKSERLKSKISVLPYRGKGTNYQTNMSSLKKNVTKEHSGEIPADKVKTAKKATKSGMELEKKPRDDIIREDLQRVKKNPTYNRAPWK